MNPEPTPPATDLPVYDAETDSCYSIEVIAELAGVDAQTILHHQEQGFIRPATRDAGDAARFDVECLRQLRRISHLRTACEMNDAGLKLMLELMRQVEGLRDELRKLHR